MGLTSHIARFNPYAMDDATVLAVATGCEQPLRTALDTLADNLTGNEQQHLLVVGPRGRGKSFFLRYLGIMFGRDRRFRHSRFISLPEEQSNVRYASDLVRMILSQLNGEGFRSVTPLWREPEALWQQSVAELEAYCREQARAHPDGFVLAVVVENLQELLARLDRTGEHRVRHLMEHLPRFTLIGATPRARVDNDYNRPIFHGFREISLPPWDEERSLAYFRRRRQLERKTSSRAGNDADAGRQEARLRAIGRYTGGSPRVAAVLAGLLLDDPGTGTAARTLSGLIDELTPYYQELVRDIPPNSLALFDALIRLGENVSQSDLAARLGASQSEISRAFRWLQEHGYVSGAKRANSKEYRYSVGDRVFALYYSRREVYHDAPYAPVSLLVDFLAAAFEVAPARRSGSLPAPDATGNWMREVDDTLRQLSGNAPADYALATRLLSRLDATPAAGPRPALLAYYFGRLVGANVDTAVLRDVAEAAIRRFPDPARHVGAEAALHVAGYREAQRAGLGENYLENLNPDLAIAVRASGL